MGSKAPQPRPQPFHDVKPVSPPPPKRDGSRNVQTIVRRAGWRLFACVSCGDVRWIATRDRFSLSSETCRCGETVYPLDEQPDESIKVDAFCNLVGHVPDRVLRIGE